jgi:hypothetical protein
MLLSRLPCFNNRLNTTLSTYCVQYKWAGVQVTNYWQQGAPNFSPKKNTGWIQNQFGKPNQQKYQFNPSAKVFTIFVKDWSFWLETSTTDKNANGNNTDYLFAVPHVGGTSGKFYEISKSNIHLFYKNVSGDLSLEEYNKEMDSIASNIIY